jgi:hypothetical protein
MTIRNDSAEYVIVYKPRHFALPPGAVVDIDADVARALIRKGATQVVRTRDDDQQARPRKYGIE